MRIPVLIESVPGNGYRASGGEPLALSAEGTTRDEAIARLKSLIADRLAVGAEFISLDVDTVGASAGLRAGLVREAIPLLDEWQGGHRDVSTPG